MSNNGNEVRFTIPGRPIPAARITRRGKRLKRQAQKYLVFKEQVNCEARKHFKSEPWDGPVGAEVKFYIKTIKSRGDG